jgi:hypothetical protein
MVMQRYVRHVRSIGEKFGSLFGLKRIERAVRDCYVVLACERYIWQPSTIHAEYLRDFHHNVVKRTNYSLHVELPFERYSRRGVYYPHRVPSRFPLERDKEDE